MDSLLEKIQALSLGYSEVVYKNRKYGVTRIDFNKGRSHKIYAEELGGKDIISLNYFRTSQDHYLKPCEMAEHKVINFLNGYQFLHPD